ncbi:MAG: glycine zipper domain-containing protein [Gammaproteobacteria bacterium]
MSKTLKTLALVGGGIGIAVVSVGALLLVQSVSHKDATPTQPVTVTVVSPSTDTQTATFVPPPVEPAAAQPIVVQQPVMQQPVQTVPVAQVIAVVPHYVTTSKPVRKCYPSEAVVYQQPQSTAPHAGAVIGGIAGGLAGSAVHGNGREVAIGAGAAIGALSGNAIQNNMNQPQAQVVRTMRCTTHTVTNKVQKGYEVTYMYNGQQGMVIMNNPPTSNVLPLPITSN